MAKFNPNDEFPQFTEVVTWPQSQNLMSLNGFRKNSALINSDKGLDIYGSSAYRVDPNWLKKAQNGELSEVDDDIMATDEINVDYGFPFDDIDD